MAGTLARKAKLQLLYRGVDLGGYCTGATFTDQAHGLGDEIRVTLEDREFKWQGPWAPRTGEKVVAWINCFDWPAPGQTMRLNCGVFQIGEPRLYGPPDMVEITGVSVNVTGSARTQTKSKNWEMVNLAGIAAHVAANSGLGLHFTGANPDYEIVAQRGESDLAFLLRLAKAAGNSVKAADGKLIVYSGAAWDAQPPVATLTRGEAWIERYDFKGKTDDKYKGCVCNYWHPYLKQHIKGEFFPPNAPTTGEILRITAPVKDQAEAVAKATAALRSKNRRQVEANFELMGHPGRRAAQVLAVKGFGRYDINYFVDKAEHRLDSNGGYTTTLEMRGSLPY